MLNYFFLIHCKFFFVFFFISVPPYTLPGFYGSLPCSPLSLPTRASLSYLTAGASADDYTAPHLPRTRGNCGQPVPVQTTIYFTDSSKPAIEELEELASRSMADVQVSARLSGHPSKYWLRATLHDFGDRRSRAPTAHLPLSVIVSYLSFS